MMNHSDPFIRMTMYAFTGAALGLVGGLVLGFIIQFISSFLISENLGDGPWQVAPFLGMGFGSVIGAVLGGLVGIRK